MNNRIAIKINPSIRDNAEYISDTDLNELNKYLMDGWIIEKEIVLSSQLASLNNNSYLKSAKSLASVIIILCK